MAIPDFIVELRAKVGTTPLWLSGVTAVVVRGDEVLLVKRADTGAWTPVTGIIDPGEEPAIAATREVLEETTVSVIAERLVQVKVTPPVIYSNGDRTQYLDLIFRMGFIEGDPFPADGENTEARWFPIGALPEMSDDMLDRLNAAFDNEPEARFIR